MRVIALSIGLLVGAPAVAAPSVYEGLWFTCIPEMVGRSNPYCLAEVREGSNGLRVDRECGSNYSAEGPAVVSAGTLAARGCPEDRGETEASCSKAGAQVFFSLTEVEAKKVHSSKALALRRSEPIRTTRENWQSLAKECEAIVEGKQPE